MHVGRLVFSQLMDFFPRHEFAKCVSRYKGNRRIRRLSCLDQFLALAFAQLTGRESLRDLVTGLSAIPEKRYHAGMRNPVLRSTLADANEKRDWRIYGDLGSVLIKQARKLYQRESFGVELEEMVFALDSTTIDLCLAVFPWAHFTHRKGAVKMHTLLDLRGNIPSFVRITHGKVNDVVMLDQMAPEPGAIYVMDRGYTDFRRLYELGQRAGFFITRAKRNLDFRRKAYRKVDRDTGLRSDHTIVLCGKKTSQRYPAPLRRVTYFDADQGHLVFLTNHFALAARAVPQLYKLRWQVELFFKWIKQHLHIKRFWGVTENAVKTQIWVAIVVYLLVAIARKWLGIQREMNEILQVLNIAILEQIDLYQLLTTDTLNNTKNGAPKQLALFDF